MLWQAVTPLEARDLLPQIRLVNQPWVSQTDQRDFHRKTMDEAYPFSESRSMSWEDLAAITGQGRSTIK